MEKNVKLKWFRKSLLLMSLLILLLFSIEICGTTHAFSNTYSSNSSLQLLINNAAEGSTIHLEPKIYYENGIIINKSVTIVGNGIDKTIIDGNNEENFIFHIVADNVKIRNLTIRNTSPSYVGVATAITISGASSVEISACKIENTEGLKLMNSFSCNILNNFFVSNTFAAITLDNSSKNIISYNTFLGNNIGVYIVPTSIGESIENFIFANNFIDNDYQVQTWLNILISNVWNLSYPFGGNYWSDYVGVDLYNGPHQNLTGSDGIGDSPYAYEDCIFDYYPLMAPVHLLDAGTWNNTNFQVIVLGYFNLSSLIFNPKLFGPSMNITVVNSPKNGICRITIPRKLLWTENSSEWLVLVNNKSINRFVTEDEKYTYIFFEFSEELFSISIFGTYAVSEFTESTFLFSIMLLICLILGLSAKRGKQRD